MTDPHAEDLLADVFPDTADAPLPVGMRDRGFGCRWLWPSPEDPRWQVEMRFLPSGDLAWVGDVRPRGEALSGPESVQGSPSTDPGVFIAPRPNENASNGNGGDT